MINLSDLEKVYQLIEESIKLAYEKGFNDGRFGRTPFNFEKRSRLSAGDRLRIKNHLMGQKRYTGHVR